MIVPTLYPKDKTAATGPGWRLVETEDGGHYLQLITKTRKGETHIINVGLFVNEPKDEPRREIAKYIKDSVKMVERL